MYTSVGSKFHFSGNFEFSLLTIRVGSSNVYITLKPLRNPYRCVYSLESWCSWLFDVTTQSHILWLWCGCMYHLWRRESFLQLWDFSKNLPKNSTFYEYKYISAQFMVSEVRLAFSPGLLSQDSKMYRYIGLKQLYKWVIYWYILVEPPNRGCF